MTEVTTFTSSQDRGDSGYIEMTSHPAIVVCGHDPLLLMTRETILFLGGYDVRPRDTVAAVVHEMQEDKPELVVVCHTFSPSEVETLLIAAFEVGCERLMLLTRRMYGVHVVVPGVWRVGSMNPRTFLQAVGAELADAQRWSRMDQMERILAQE